MARPVGMEEDDRASGPSALPLEMPSPVVYERLRAALAQQAQAPAPRAPRLRRTALVVLPLLALAALAVDALLRDRSILRADASSFAHVCMPIAVGALALALWSTALAISRGRDGLGERVPVLRLATLSVAPLSLILILALAGVGHAETESLHPLGLPCFIIAAAIAAASLAVLVSELRHSVPVAAGWRSAALGSAAAAWSSFALLLHCSSVDILHLLTGHWLPICVFPLVGLVFARRHLKL